MDSCTVWGSQGRHIRIQYHLIQGIIFFLTGGIRIFQHFSLEGLYHTAPCTECPLQQGCDNPCPLLTSQRDTQLWMPCVGAAAILRPASATLPSRDTPPEALNTSWWRCLYLTLSTAEVTGAFAFLQSCFPLSSLIITSRALALSWGLVSPKLVWRYLAWPTREKSEMGARPCHPGK